MSEQNGSLLTIPGCINDKVYWSLKKYMLAPRYKLVLFVLLAAYELYSAVRVIQTGNLPDLSVMALIAAVAVFAYKHNQNSSVKRALSARKEFQQGGMQVLIAFERDNVKLYNRTTGTERTLTYSLIHSMLENDACIALYTNKRSFMMIPKDQMTDSMRDRALAIIHEKCPNIKKRW